MPDFGEELALRFEPIGIGVARKSEPAAALGDEIGAHRYLLGGWIECIHGYWRRLDCDSLNGASLGRRFSRLGRSRPCARFRFARFAQRSRVGLIFLCHRSNSSLIYG